MQSIRLWSSRLWSVGVLVALVALGYWGHENHWKIPAFSSFGKDGEDAKSPGVKKTPAPKDGFPLIEFASPEAVLQVGIACETAIKRELDLIVQANATVGYDQTKVAQVSARVSGQVWKVTARQGQFVRKGDLLAIIDSLDVGRSRTEFLQEHSSHHFAARRLERLQSFAKKGAVSEASLREAELAEWEARARRFNAHQRLLNLGLDADLAAIHQETPDQVASNIQMLGLCTKVRALLKLAPKTANLIPMFAPLDGVVTQYDIVVGERIAPEVHQIEIADVRTMWIRLAVRKEDAGRLALGQMVRYTSAAHGQSVVGQLDWISTGLDERTRTVQARASAVNPSLRGSSRSQTQGPWLLRANEFGNTEIKVGSISQAIMVPASAIQRLDGHTLIFIAQSDLKTFEPRKVTLGESRGDWIQIRQGVQAGERVATANSFVLKSELMKDSLEAP